MRRNEQEEWDEKLEGDGDGEGDEELEGDGDVEENEDIEHP